MSKPLISILMPVKNTGAFLVECLHSIINQTYINWELIAVDDHSEDESYQTLVTYAKKDTRIQVVKNTAHGIIAALRKAYSMATGQFITRMDSDDIMAPKKLELMLNQLQSKGNGYLAVGLVHYFRETELGDGYRNYAHWLNQLTNNASNFSEIYKECTIPSPCWMLNRIDLDSCGGFTNDVYPEDYDLAFRFRKAGLQITAVKEVIHHWRDYDTRTSRTDINYSDNRFSELKVIHFIDQDRDTNLPLVLWGAGHKGKKIASLLNNEEVSFQWICNNTNKIGKEIYGTILEDLPTLRTNPRAQVIVAVSSQHDKNEIELLISQNMQHQYFRFF